MSGVWVRLCDNWFFKDCSISEICWDLRAPKLFFFLKIWTKQPQDRIKTQKKLLKLSTVIILCKCYFKQKTSESVGRLYGTIQFKKKIFKKNYFLYLKEIKTVPKKFNWKRKTETLSSCKFVYKKLKVFVTLAGGPIFSTFTDINS
jgi:hypothetical protein